MTDEQHGSIVDQHDPHALHRCGAAGQVRASRHADGAGAAGLHDLEPRDALRSAGPDLAQPRPVCALQRPRLDAALVRSSPHRTSGGERRLRAAWATVGDAGRHPPVPATRQQGAGPSRVPLGFRRRDHHRAAGPRRRHQRRHGHRPKMARQPLQPARVRHVQLQHLCRLRRRLPDGRRRVGGGLARRPLGLDNLCWVYDNNHITIEGNTRIAFTEDVAARFLLTAGTCCASATPTTWIASSKPCRFSARPKAGPRSSSWTATSATALRTSRTRPKPTASRWARRKSASPSAVYGWPEDAKFLVPDGVYEHFAAGIGARGSASPPRVDGHFSPAYRSEIPGTGGRDRPDAAARIARPGGTATSPSFLPTRRESPAAKPPARC